MVEDRVRIAFDATPSELESFAWATQGSSFLATLGYRMQSLRDSSSRNGADWSATLGAAPPRWAWLTAQKRRDVKILPIDNGRFALLETASGHRLELHLFLAHFAFRLNIRHGCLAFRLRLRNGTRRRNTTLDEADRDNRGRRLGRSRRG